MLGGLTGAITKVVCFALVCLPCIYVAQKQQADLEKLGSETPPYGPRLSQPESVDRRSPTLEVRALALFDHHRLHHVGLAGRVFSEMGLESDSWCVIPFAYARHPCRYVGSLIAFARHSSPYPACDTSKPWFCIHLGCHPDSRQIHINQRRILALWPCGTTATVNS